jgi:uroporphyrin-III C-methyltransferase / precorrin-2 dehydrogenase / sirohydrochlorin ferrochelatase
MESSSNQRLEAAVPWVCRLQIGDRRNHGTILAHRRSMQSFPLFLKLKDRQTLVVGGGEQAARKAELLLAAGAKVSLIAETVVGEIANLIAERRIAWSGHSFHVDDLEGTSLVIVAVDDDALQGRVSQAAQRRGVPVNVVDCPLLSSFTMPSIVDRGPVTIAISTGGAAPALARRLRAEIERALPTAIGRLARFAEIFRAQVQRTLTEPRARRRFWDRVFEGRVGELALAGDEIAARRELIRLLDGARNPRFPVQGMVHIVGSGPGDPDLLTLKAHRLLHDADVVVYDELVSPQVLAMVRRDAERVVVGPRMARTEIGQRLLALVADGRSVVRLRSGEAVAASGSGRDDDEIKALETGGVSVEIVPGIVADAASTALARTR